MLGLYVPTCVLLIGVSNIPLPWLTITYAVLLFIVAPTFIAVIARVLIIRYYGIKALDGIVNRFKPVTIICLLLTLVLIFIFQGTCMCMPAFSHTYTISCSYTVYVVFMYVLILCYIYYAIYLLYNTIIYTFVYTTIILIHSMYILYIGQKISQKPLQIVLIAIPITIQCTFNFILAYYTGYATCLSHDKLAPASMIATRYVYTILICILLYNLMCILYI